MPADAGIQSAVEFNNFKDLDSRFRGNDVVFPITTQPPEGGGKGGGDAFENFYAAFRFVSEGGD
jgi:hypothetical protein